jgi:predicted NodU family carbamoyl transferase
MQDEYIISMRHHDNHAYFSYAMSPFAGSNEPVMIIAMDGQVSLDIHFLNKKKGR